MLKTTQTAVHNWPAPFSVV